MSSFKVGAKAALFAAALALPASVHAAPQKADAPGGDIPAKFVKPEIEKDYVKRVEMIPMRDGIKLYTVIWIPKDAHDAPIILTRTPSTPPSTCATKTAPPS